MSGENTGKPDVMTPPDAELIALCDRYVTVAEAVRASFNGCETREAERARDAKIAPLEDELHTIADALDALPAQTVQGVQALYRAVVAETPECLVDRSGCLDDQLIARLLRDLGRLPGWATGAGNRS